MRRRTLLLSTLLLLALLPGGWGHVLAAAFCAHDIERPAMMAEDHECCRAHLEQQQDQHSCEAASFDHSPHEAMAMDEAEAKTSAAARQAGGQALTLERAGEECLHCVSRGGLPPTLTITRAPEQERRGALLSAPSAVKTVAPPAARLAPALSARQHAPPGTIIRRHLLFAVFVI